MSANYITVAGFVQAKENQVATAKSSERTKQRERLR